MSLRDVLFSDGPAADRRAALELYAFLVGAWRTEVLVHDDAGQVHHGTGEIHADWVLEGRAIQDVWMIPARDQRRPGAPPMPVAGDWFGTTLRVFDPKLAAWRIFWIDPATGNYLQQTGCAEGDGIVQLGEDAGGKIRWSFHEIAAASFYWSGERSRDDGRTWTRRVELLATRV